MTNPKSSGNCDLDPQAWDAPKVGYHVHNWGGRMPHAFEFCCFGHGWGGIKTCKCGFSEKNRAVHA